MALSDSASITVRAPTTQGVSGCVDLSSCLIFPPIFETDIGCRSFSVAAPTLLNSLPDNVESVNIVMQLRYRPLCRAICMHLLMAWRSKWI